MLNERIIPQYGLPYTGSGAEAEERVWQFLCDLPDEYFILRELRTLPSLSKRQAGGEEDRIDLVVIGPETGIIILEVKDWNIRRNEYRWINQYTVQKVDEKGHITELRNPQAQTEEYYHAVRELLLPQGLSSIHVQRLLVFPKLTRTEFENRFVVEHHGTQHNPQERFNINLDRTLFRDDLDLHRNQPLQLFSQHSLSSPKVLYSAQVIEKIVNTLIPSKMRVGDPTKYDSGHEKLQLFRQ